MWPGAPTTLLMGLILAQSTQMQDCRRRSSIQHAGSHSASVHGCSAGRRVHDAGRRPPPCRSRRHQSRGALVDGVCAGRPPLRHRASGTRADSEHERRDVRAGVDDRRHLRSRRGRCPGPGARSGLRDVAARVRLLHGAGGGRCGQSPRSLPRGRRTSWGARRAAGRRACQHHSRRRPDPVRARRAPVCEHRRRLHAVRVTEPWLPGGQDSASEPRRHLTPRQPFRLTRLHVRPPEPAGFRLAPRDRSALGLRTRVHWQRRDQCPSVRIQLRVADHRGCGDDAGHGGADGVLQPGHCTVRRVVLPGPRGAAVREQPVRGHAAGHAPAPAAAGRRGGPHRRAGAATRRSVWTHSRRRPRA